MDTLQKHTSINAWIYMMIGLVLLTILSVFYFFFYQKSYEMTVETSCDPATEQCFYRDCEAEECPPNQLTYYSQYTIRASDFAFCEKENCHDLCKNTGSPCVEIQCDSAVDMCSELPK